MSTQSAKQQKKKSCLEPLVPLPEGGKFLVDQWGSILGRTPETLRKWLEEYAVPHQKAKDLVVIDAAMFWEHIPWENLNGEEKENA